MAPSCCSGSCVGGHAGGWHSAQRECLQGCTAISVPACHGYDSLSGGAGRLVRTPPRTGRNQEKSPIGAAPGYRVGRRHPVMGGHHPVPRAARPPCLGFLQGIWTCCVWGAGASPSPKALLALHETTALTTKHLQSAGDGGFPGRGPTFFLSSQGLLEPAGGRLGSNTGSSVSTGNWPMPQFPSLSNMNNNSTGSMHCCEDQMN